MSRTMPLLNRHCVGDLRKHLRGAAGRAAPFLGTITAVATDESVVALTFDDGPHPDSTPIVLDLLDRYRAKATFFMLGERAAQYPELVNRAVEAGHAVATHGWEHRSLVLERPPGRAGLRWQQSLIRRGSQSLGYGGARLFRPPYGHQDLRAHLMARSVGVEVIGWNVVAGDWNNEAADVIAARVLADLSPGCVVLWHDALADAYDASYFDRSEAIAALDVVLSEASDRYRFVTIPELLRCGRARRRYFYPRPDADSLHALHGP